MNYNALIAKVGSLVNRMVNSAYSSSGLLSHQSDANAPGFRA